MEGIPRLSTKVFMISVKNISVHVNMDLNVESWILSESAKEAVSRKKGSCRRDSVNFRYKRFLCTVGRVLILYLGVLCQGAILLFPKFQLSSKVKKKREIHFDS